MLRSTITDIGDLVDPRHAARFADWVDAEPEVSEGALQAVWFETSDLMFRLLPRRCVEGARL
jgi:hypothetical protein